MASGGLDDGAEDGGALGAFVGAGKHPVPAAHGQAAQSALDVAVVELEVTILERANQGVPVIVRIGDRLAQRALGWEATRVLVEPLLSGIEQWPGLALAAQQPFVGPLAGFLGRGLDAVHLADEHQFSVYR